MLQPLGWRPDGSELLLFRLDRWGTKPQVMAADPATGATRVVFTEPTRVFPWSWEQRFTLLQDGKHFLWLSGKAERSLALYDMEGHSLGRLTDGELQVERVVAVDEKAGWVYFTAQGARPRPADSHLYRVSLDGKGFTRLTEATGLHEIQLAMLQAPEVYHVGVAVAPITDMAEHSGWGKSFPPEEKGSAMSPRLSISRHTAHGAGRSMRHDPLAAMPRPRVLALIVSILGCALPALAARESGPRSVLGDAPGLEKRVTYSETKIPLGELVAKVATDTGVSLTAARDVADEPVAVVVSDFPARELLEQLADLLGYQWSRRTAGVQVFRSSGVQADVGLTATTQRPEPPTPEHLNTRTPEHPFRYEIWQDLASKQREEALRRAQSAGVEQRFLEELAICRELAGKSPEEMRRLGEEMTRWNERMRQLTPEERQALLRVPEFQHQNLPYRMVASLWPPFKRSLAGLMTRLSPAQWEALRAGRQLVYASDPQKGKLPLPQDVLRVFRTSPLSVPLPGQPRPARSGDEERARRVREQQESWDQAEQYEVILRLVAFESCWWDPGGIQFMAVVAPVRGGQRLGLQGDWAGFTVYIYPDKAEPPREEGAQRRALLERDPVVSVKKPFQPSSGPYVDPLFPGASRTGRLLPELLPELARAYGIHFIADSYWGVAWRVGWATDRSFPAGPRPLFDVLDGLTSRHYQWDRRGSLIRIRDRKWFVHRPQEIPLRTVRRWTALHDRLGALPLEECVLAATTLTDLQADTLEILVRRAVFPPPLNDLGSLAGSLGLLRLYGRLSPDQREALQAGQPLTTALLSPALRPFVRAQLYRVHRDRFPMPDLEPWGGGYLTLTRTPDVRIREQRGPSVTWRLASAPAPRGVKPPEAVTRFPVTRLRMEIHYGAQTPAAVGLIVAADAAPSE